MRKDWVELSEIEKQSYLQAVKTLASNPAYKLSYESLINEYHASFNTTAQSTDPTVSQYLPYLRSFLLKYESLLHEIDCRITIPYWDFTALPLTPYTHPIWDNTLGFGNQSRSDDNCVSVGPFSLDQFNTPTGTCLKRKYSDNRMFPSRSIIDRDILPLPAEEFNDFHRNIQLFIGSTVLCNVGGDLCGHNSAVDPIFPLFVSFIDSTFDRWQSFEQGRESVRYSQDDTPLTFSSPLQRVSEYTSNKNLPNEISVCYTPPVFHKRHPPPPPSSSLLTQEPVINTVITALPDCHTNNNSKGSSDDMEFMHMSTEDTSFMNIACNRERQFENLSSS